MENCWHSYGEIHKFSVVATEKNGQMFAVWAMTTFYGDANFLHSFG